MTISPEVTSENVTTYIVDSGGKFPERTVSSLRFDNAFRSFVAGPDDKHYLELEIRKAHVICVVYAIDNSNSFNRIPVYWLPYFRQLGINVRRVYRSRLPSVLTRSLGPRHPGREQDRSTRRRSDK